jgi:hypothetical protein
VAAAAASRGGSSSSSNGSSGGGGKRSMGRRGPNSSTGSAGSRRGGGGGSSSSGGLWEQVVALEAAAAAEVLARAQVVTATCVGAGDALLADRSFPVAVVDEATQAPEPAALTAIAQRVMGACVGLLSACFGRCECVCGSRHHTGRVVASLAAATAVTAQCWLLAAASHSTPHALTGATWPRTPHPLPQPATAPHQTGAVAADGGRPAAAAAHGALPWRSSTGPRYQHV